MKTRLSRRYHLIHVCQNHEINVDKKIPSFFLIQTTSFSNVALSCNRFTQGAKHNNFTVQHKH